MSTTKTWTTLDTLTNDRIARLLAEALRAGDEPTILDCERALLGHRDGAARRRILAIVRDTEAQAQAES